MSRPLPDLSGLFDDVPIDARVLASMVLNAYISGVYAGLMHALDDHPAAEPFAKAAVGALSADDAALRAIVETAVVTATDPTSVYHAGPVVVAEVQYQRSVGGEL